MERSEAELIAAVLKGDSASFEPLVAKYSPRVFATARRYARRDSEVEDIAQEVWFKAFQKLRSFRGEAPFEHWLMRLAVRTCYDFLRGHQRNRELAYADLTEPEEDW
ncbi:MAG TPA: sigma-70 family RNA polymerase sigma factor, partial [Verrucomicrobiae bacterium]